MAAHNRRYSDDVVCIGGVGHDQEKAKRNDGKEGTHLLFGRRTDARASAPGFQKRQTLRHPFNALAGSLEDFPPHPTFRKSTAPRLIPSQPIPHPPPPPTTPTSPL